MQASMTSDNKRVVRVYNPASAASSNIPIENPELWSGIYSSNNSSIAELKDEIVSLGIAHQPFTLALQHGFGWMKEEFLSTLPAQEQLPAGPVVNVRIEYPGFWSRVGFLSNLSLSAFHSHIQGKWMGVKLLMHRKTRATPHGNTPWYPCCRKKKALIRQKPMHEGCTHI